MISRPLGAKVLVGRLCAKFGCSVVAFDRWTWDGMYAIDVLPRRLPGQELTVYFSEAGIAVDQGAPLESFENLEQAWPRIAEIGQRWPVAPAPTASDCWGWGQHIFDPALDDKVRRVGEAAVREFGNLVSIVSRADVVGRTTFMEMLSPIQDSVRLRVRLRGHRLEIESDWRLGDDGNLVTLAPDAAEDWLIRAGRFGVVELSRHRLFADETRCFPADDDKIRDALRKGARATHQSRPWTAKIDATRSPGASRSN